MKQTAVEWLCSQIYTIQVELECGNNLLKNKIEQAKEMERQQLYDAWNDGNNRYSGCGDSETYYETFYTE